MFISRLVIIFAELVEGFVGAAETGVEIGVVVASLLAEPLLDSVPDQRKRVQYDPY